MNWNLRVIVPFLLSVNYLQAYTPCRVCTDIKYFPLLQKDTKLQGYEFVSFTDKGLLGCVKQCLLRRRCRSFNYDMDKGVCGLNNRISPKRTARHAVVYSPIQGWPQELAGVCANHNCSMNSRCDKGNQSKSYTCIPVKTDTFIHNKTAYKNFSIVNMFVLPRDSSFMMTTLKPAKASNHINMLILYIKTKHLLSFQTPASFDEILKFERSPNDMVRVADTEIAICDSSVLNLYLVKMNSVTLEMTTSLSDGCQTLAILPHASKNNFSFVVLGPEKTYLLDAVTFTKQYLKLEVRGTVLDLASVKGQILCLSTDAHRLVSLDTHGTMLWSRRHTKHARSIDVDDDGFIFINELTFITVLWSNGTFWGRVHLQNSKNICILDLSIFENKWLVIITCEWTLWLFERDRNQTIK